ncbi:MAG: hypothetical protein LBM25_04115 [Bacteroidales bacterium]|nr:hypothetical protein [Bacteroidales bacterium]
MKRKLKFPRIEKGFCPTILTKIILLIFIVVCIVSVLFNLFIGIFHNYLIDFLSSATLPSFIFFAKTYILEIANNHIIYFIVTGLIKFVMLISFIALFRGYTTGYYSYLLAQIISISFPLLLLGKKAFASGDIMIALFLIVFLFVEIVLHPNKNREKIIENKEE